MENCFLGGRSSSLTKVSDTGSWAAGLHQHFLCGSLCSRGQCGVGSESTGCGLCLSQASEEAAISLRLQELVTTWPSEEEHLGESWHSYSGCLWVVGMEVRGTGLHLREVKTPWVFSGGVPVLWGLPPSFRPLFST